MVKEIADHLPVIIFTKYNIDTDKPAPVVNILPVRFIGVLTSQGIKISIKGAWDPERSVAVINTVEVPVEEALDDIGMRSRNVVVHMVCDGKASLERLIEEE